MNLDQIQEMWERDAVIDPDNLHDESLKIPQLHSKYYTVYNTITLLREKAREQYSKIRLQRYNYYTGKAEPEVYAEDPFPYKVREKDAIQRHLDADEKLTKKKQVNTNPQDIFVFPLPPAILDGVTAEWDNESSFFK